MKIAYLGNFRFPWCTESHVALTLEDLGHEVVRIQEDQHSVDQVVDQCAGAGLFLWTRTYGMLQGDAFSMLQRIKSICIKTVSFHLDYYFGISRQTAMPNDAFWFTDFVFQPDGDHIQEFRDMGIKAYFSPPAVFKGGCELFHGPFITNEQLNVVQKFEHDLIFVGTSNGYHSEWPWRQELITSVKREFPQLELYPQGEAVRESALNALYASTKVVIGDSIMADRTTTYTSDRIFETTGRGGFIIYPNIPWVTEQFSGHLATYEVGDVSGLVDTIRYYLSHDEERESKRLACFEITKTNHTYHNRLSRVLEIVGTPV